MDSILIPGVVARGCQTRLRQQKGLDDECNWKLYKSDRDVLPPIMSHLGM